MVEEGIVRRLDNLGRVVIPKEMRKLMNVKEKDFVRIIKQNNSIIIQKFSRSCMICGSENLLNEYGGLCLCEGCIGKMKKIGEGQRGI
ncbi:MAG: AbrB/MazE/SpoVT family DNA-binding domain-containing protein [Romboutsia sp.]|nr:AbrB/MazE/SpoVT family DNA-binding domain-containing protein [Romboutsia sp.]